MRSVFLLIFLLPAFSFSQVKKSTKSQTKVLSTVLDGYVIAGNVTGFADGTPVAFLNEKTGAPDKQGVIKGGKFIIKGKVDQPGFKGLIFNNEQPLIPLFLDNSAIKITGSRSALDKLIITGSPAHNQYTNLISSLKPYEHLLLPEAAYDSAAINKLAGISEAFVKNNPGSFVSPLAIIRLYQATQNGFKAEELYKLLPAQIKNSQLGLYVTQLIEESKINPIGSFVQDFSQADTAGIAVSISSLKGKYVLIDFWASWCRPCRDENPNVVAAFDKFKEKNFTVLGISLDQNKKAWLDAIKMDGLKWGQLSDLKGWGNAVAAIFKISSIPQNLLLDTEGKIIAKNLRGAVLESRLSSLLK